MHYIQLRLEASSITVESEPVEYQSEAWTFSVFEARILLLMDLYVLRENGFGIGCYIILNIFIIKIVCKNFKHFLRFYFENKPYLKYSSPTVIIVGENTVIDQTDKLTTGQESNDLKLDTNKKMSNFL